MSVQAYHIAYDTTTCCSMRPSQQERSGGHAPCQITGTLPPPPCCRRQQPLPVHAHPHFYDVAEAGF
eukprot:1151247-Pelagomonas_calceolata.AAC.4